MCFPKPPKAKPTPAAITPARAEKSKTPVKIRSEDSTGQDDMSDLSRKRRVSASLGL